MDVRSAMTADPACCTASSTLQYVAQLMVENDCGEIPVVDDHRSRKPMGVVTDRDIATRTVARGINPMDVVAADCMSSPCITVTPDMDLRQCCEVMESSQIRRVLVVDEAGAVCGIVSLADVTRHAGDKATVEVVKEVSSPP